MVGSVMIVIEPINLTTLGIPGIVPSKHPAYSRTRQLGYTHIYEKELHRKVLVCILESGFSKSHIPILSLPPSRVEGL